MWVVHGERNMRPPQLHLRNIEGIVYHRSFVGEDDLSFGLFAAVIVEMRL